MTLDDDTDVSQKKKKAPSEDEKRYFLYNSVKCLLIIEIIVINVILNK